MMSGGLERVDLRLDVFELRVAVGMARAFAGFAVRLQAEAQTTQQASDQFLTGGEAAFGQRTGEMTLAFADSKQRRLGGATDRRLYKVAQRLQQPWLCLDLRLAPATRAADAQRRCIVYALQLRKPAAKRAARNAGRLRDSGNATAARGLRLAGREQPPRTLVQVLKNASKRALIASVSITHPG